MNVYLEYLSLLQEVHVHANRSHVLNKDRSFHYQGIYNYSTCTNASSYTLTEKSVSKMLTLLLLKPYPMVCPFGRIVSLRRYEGMVTTQSLVKT